MTLKDLCGAELFAQVQEKLDEVNGKQKDKSKHVRFIDLSEGGYVLKEDYDSKVTELSGVKNQLTDANKEIQSYKDMDIEGIKESAKEWEEKYKADTAALNNKLTAQERAHQIDMFLSGYKFTSKAAQAGIRMEFDKKEFKLEDGVFQGASDYMKSLMENEEYKGAFVQEKKPDDELGGGAGTGNGGKPLPSFAMGTNGGTAGTGTEKNIFNFGFSRLREPEKKE